MNELFNIFFSPKGRISPLWYVGTSLIILSLFFLSPYPLIIDIIQRWEYWKPITIEKIILLGLSSSIGLVMYTSWIIVSIKRIKDSSRNLKGYYFLILVLTLTLFLSIVYNYPNTSIFIHLIATIYFLLLEGSTTSNTYGAPFHFVFPWIGIDKKDKAKNAALIEKIGLYELYIKTNGLKGKNASFAQDDFSGMVLLNRNFTDADLSAANFDGANLRNCTFKNATITKASFRAADLSYTDFTNCKGSKEAIFARANLEGSNLTDDLADPETLTQIGELAKITKPIFIGLLSACVYSWITIATIQDVALISDSREVVLPIIQVKIAVSGFFFSTPIILYFIFLYFNLYLRKLWKEVSSLPFKLQNGKEAVAKVYPWLLISIGNSNFIDETMPYISFKRIEIIICFLLAWWVVPLTMGIFWIDSLVRHDWWMASFLIFMLILSVSTALIYQINSLSVLYREQLSKDSPWKPTIIIGGILASCCFLYTYNGMVGIQKPKYTANLERAFLVPKPSGYIASSNQEKHKDIVGPDLSGCDLRFAKARGIFGVNTIFKKAKMTGIGLQSSHLTGSSFRETQLDSADFREAQLDSADFREAQLQGATFLYAQLQGATFLYAQLQGATFWNAQLQGAFLGVTQLQGADFLYAQLQGATFWKAQLQGATFWKTKLQGADFGETQLDSAKVHFPYWLDSLDTWEVKGREALQKKYYVDTTPHYRKYDKNKKHPFYYIKRRESTENN